MEHNPPVEHETALEHALDIAQRNAKEAKRLFDDARAKHVAGDVDEARVAQLATLLDLANEDLARVTKEN